MNPTGVHLRKRRFSRLAFGAFGLALAAMILGTGNPSFAEVKDLTKPRVERVPDEDGSIWEVQIVPLQLYRPKPICPVPLDKAEPTPAAQPLVPPVPGRTYEEEPKPAPKQDAAFKHDARPETELIALQKDKADKKADKKKADKKADRKKADKKDDKKADKKKADKKADKKDEAAEPPFGVEIVPRFTIPQHPQHQFDEEYYPPVSCPGHVHPADYDHVYHSIPFIRSEYIANPAYRHEATMEFLFGKLRPMVVNKNPQPRPHETQFPFENDIIRPYSYYSLAPGAGYGRGPLPFASPGAYGVNYNFYYPGPTVYRAY